MEKQNLKYVVGTYAEGVPADILFYSDVEKWNVNDFLHEFNYLEEYIHPSVIRVHINSAGGSCIEGISVFSKIIDCKIPTHCINDGIAASMASIIWSAGDEVYMKDYALLMIHNPFIDNGPNDKEYNQVTEAFTKQLSTIYKQRFGLDEETVKRIMDGDEGNDGTFFTAQEAVNAGFISESHILKTPEAVRNRVAASINGLKDLGKISNIMGLVNEAETQNDVVESIKEQKDSELNHINLNQVKMDKNELTAVAALLGLTGDKATESNVLAEVNKLKDADAKLTEAKAELNKVKKELSDTQTELNGSKATVANLQKDLQETKDSLKSYQDAEAEARNKQIEEMVDAAINSCKINKDDRETWIESAQSNLELVKRTLDSIPARENISEQTNTPENKKEAQENLKDTEAQMQEKVEEVVGKDFKFRTLE